MSLSFHSSTWRPVIKYTERLEWLKPCYLQGCTVWLITFICGNRLEKCNRSVTGRTHVVCADLTELLHITGQVPLKGSQRFFSRGESHVLNTIKTSYIYWPLNLGQINLRIMEKATSEYLEELLQMEETQTTSLHRCHLICNILCGLWS